MKISFLVTYYNQEQYVKKSLDSILDIRKPQEWEILIGDDGSTDGTIANVKKYIEQYPNNIKLFVMPRDGEKKYDSVKRASANRLNLLENMTGDCFCFLDGDDYYCDIEFVEDAIAAFKQNESISIVAFGYKYVYDVKTEIQHNFPIEINKECINKKNYLKRCYTHAGACVHRVMWDKERIAYIKNIGYFDDNNIVINSLNYGEMYTVARVVYAYRQTGVSVYTSMDSVEKSVLNVQGMDVDIKLIKSDYINVIYERNVESIIKMFIWRKKLRKILGSTKYKLYRSNSEKIEDALSFKMLSYDTLGKKSKRKILKLIFKLSMMNPKTALKVYLNKQ